MAMSELVQVELPKKGLKARITARRDLWWVPQMLTFMGFSAFLIYANWAAWQGEHYTSGPYLSPFYSPELWGTSPHAWFGPPPSWYPSFLPFSPALLILWIPGLFRFTCYYYRGAYYKAFWADPPSCAVGEPRKGYLGEQTFPLIVQNVHRYILYLALPVIGFLWWDVWQAFWFDDGFGIGVGTVVLAVNTTLLTGYTLGCHSLRHIIGGHKDEMSGAPVRKACYEQCSKFNGAHMRWAWFSLFSVAFTDLYVRMCSMGIWHDWRIL
jgi:hypothetical protein